MKTKPAKKKMMFLTSALAMCLVYTACGASESTSAGESQRQLEEAPRNEVDMSNKQSQGIEIRIRTDDKEATATLVDSAATRDFVSQLPLTLVLEDFNKVEKIRVLPKKLTAEGSASRGDVAYYAPWGNLAIFYKDLTSGSEDLIILGKIDTGKEIFNVPGSVKVTIELVK